VAGKKNIYLFDKRPLKIFMAHKSAKKSLHNKNIGNKPSSLRCDLLLKSSLSREIERP